MRPPEAQSTHACSLAKVVMPALEADRRADAGSVDVVDGRLAARRAMLIPRLAERVSTTCARTRLGVGDKAVKQLLALGAV